MTHTEQAIKEAVEKGGWKAPVRYGQILNSVGLLTASFKHETSKTTIYLARIFLDPSFWQALGRARGWDDYDEDGDHFGLLTYLLVQDEIIVKIAQWKFHWHRFIDHIGDGKDAESFFAEAC